MSSLHVRQRVSPHASASGPHPTPGLSLTSGPCPQRPDGGTRLQAVPPLNKSGSGPMLCFLGWQGSRGQRLFSSQVCVLCHHPPYSLLYSPLSFCPFTHLPTYSPVIHLHSLPPTHPSSIHPPTYLSIYHPSTPPSTHPSNHPIIQPTIQPSLSVHFLSFLPFLSFSFSFFLISFLSFPFPSFSFLFFSFFFSSFFLFF